MGDEGERGGAEGLREGEDGGEGVLGERGGDGGNLGEWGAGGDDGVTGVDDGVEVIGGDWCLGVEKGLKSLHFIWWKYLQFLIPHHRYLTELLQKKGR